MVTPNIMAVNLWKSKAVPLLVARKQGRGRESGRGARDKTQLPEQPQ
jgi:hypothetical protein